MSAQYAYTAPSPYPPSFEGNPYAYGFGLFGDVSAAALGLAMLLTAIYEPIRKRRVLRLLKQAIHPTSIARWSPIFLYRSQNISILLFVVMRTLPDAIWMVLWGDVTEPTVRLLLALDLTFDGLAQLPLFWAIICYAWGKQVIPQMLVEGADKPRGRPDFMLVWRNARILIVVVLIAIGVTIGKATG